MPFDQTVRAPAPKGYRHERAPGSWPLDGGSGERWGSDRARGIRPTPRLTTLGPSTTEHHVTDARLIDTAAPREPRGVALVLHGGGARRGPMRVSPAQLSV